MSPLRRTVFAALALIALGQGASAHAHLTEAVPAANGSVAASPTALHLTFSEGLTLRFSGATLTGPDQAPVATGPAALATGHDTTLVIPIPDRLAPGLYTVEWHALATDGHKTTGRYTFTVEP